MNEWKPLEDSQAQLPSTHWSQVLNAASADEETKKMALGELAWRYGNPLYAYARKLGNSQEQSQDYVQGFLENAIEKDLFSKADRNVGTLRSYLLKSFKNYTHNEHEKRTAEKRGGGSPHFPFDLPGIESEINNLSNQNLSPDKLYDRRWLMDLTNRSIAFLRQAYEAKGRIGEFDLLARFLEPRDRSGEGTEAAEKLGLSVNTFQVRVGRLRKQLRRQILIVIKQEVGTEVDAEEELRRLLDEIESD